MMDFYLGGGIDYAFLGVGEAGIWPYKECLKKENACKKIWLIHASAIVEENTHWILLRADIVQIQILYFVSSWRRSG